MHSASLAKSLQYDTQQDHNITKETRQNFYLKILEILAFKLTLRLMRSELIEVSIKHFSASFLHIKTYKKKQLFRKTCIIEYLLFRPLVLSKINIINNKPYFNVRNSIYAASKTIRWCNCFRKFYWYFYQYFCIHYQSATVDRESTSSVFFYFRKII